MDDHNPYASPTRLTNSSPRDGDERRRAEKRPYLGWSLVFSFNMAVPLLCGWWITGEHGRIGMWVGAVLLFTCGCCVCGFSRRWAAPFIVGAVLVGLTQVVPILQFIAGTIGLGVGGGLGLAVVGDNGTTYQIISELGGFVVTFVTGGVMMIASAVTGLVIRKLTPNRWWK